MKIVLALLLAPLSVLYAQIMRVRAWCYLVGILPSESSGAFVVSIGNIQAGGTGKTPIVDFFARRWRTHQRLGIVSRGYGRSTSGSLRVDAAAKDAADRFGDEATWLAASLSDGSGPIVPVQVGERRVTAARDLIVSEAVKLLLLDDGFQHMAIRRSFDIVLIDVSAPLWQWRVIPWGRLRESKSALRRADLVILTKTESCESTTIDALETEVAKCIGADCRVLRFRQQVSWSKQVAGEPLVVAAGLARPETFFKMVRSDETRPDVVAEVPFPDHHEFTSRDVNDLKELARLKKAGRVLVTEKDAVKLRNIWNPVGVSMDIELAVSKLEVLPLRESDKKQLEQVDEFILRGVRGLPGTGRKLSDRSPSA